MSRHGEDPVWRLLNPRSVAIVGASNSNAGLKEIVDLGTARGIAFSLVNPRSPEVFGQRTYPKLTDIETPVDVILSRVSADATIEVVEQASAIGAVGIVAVAAQFAEVGEVGAQKQALMTRLARDAGLTMVGPNCLGYFNVTEGIKMCATPIPEQRAGNVAFVAQSGGMLTSIFFGVAERRIGVTYAISSGNEAVTDMCDFVEVLLNDDHTDAIGLVIEQIRRPELFVDLAYRAREAGKAIIALKMGRSERGQRVANSHTGALMQDARAYDAAFKQCGVGIATDIDDLLDQLQLFAHWPRSSWGGANRTAIVTASGGSSGLISDAFDAQGLTLFEDPTQADWVQQTVPGSSVSNPLDVTGINFSSDAVGKIYGQFLDNDAYDTLIVVGYLDETQEGFAQPMVEPLRAAAPNTTKRLLMVSSETGRIGTWTDTALLAENIAVGRGIPQTVRSLKAMHQFTTTRTRPRITIDPTTTHTQIPRTINTDQGQLALFDDTMSLLQHFGIPVAPYLQWPATDQQLHQLAHDTGTDKFVVKLANVLHRTEHHAVLLGLTQTELPAAIKELQEIAKQHNLAPEIVIQPQLDILGEIFIGIQAHSVFGPVVLTGIGGVFLEVLNDSTTRLAPFGTPDATDMLNELAGAQVLHGFRGAQPWHPNQLTQLLTNASTLAATTTTWLESLDINPIVVHTNGLAAVDASCLINTQPAVG